MCRIKVLFTVLLAAAAAGCSDSAGSKDSNTEITELIIFNAASTTELVNALGQLFYAQTGIIIKSNPASSGTLARQLEHGAEADIYISAAGEWADYVNKPGLTYSCRPFVRNRLVLISPVNSAAALLIPDKETAFPDLFTGRISMGDPAHVPAGRYAVQALEYFGWYNELRDRILPTSDVRSALLVVEMGEADFGIVYSTDAARSDKVSVTGIFPEVSHSPIIYYCSLMKNNSGQAKLFYDFIVSGKNAQKVYTEFGFSLAEIF